jgi:Cu/Ag efflux protein CusF
MLKIHLVLPLASAIGFASMTAPTLAMPVTTMKVHPSGGSFQLVHAGHHHAAQASGTVNSVDAGEHTINISHEAIKAFGLPAMTTDLAVNPSIDLTAIKPGMKVSFSLVKAEDGSFLVDALMPPTDR